MQFMPMRALSREPQTVLACLQREGEVVVTNNGQPLMLLVDLVGRDIIETVSNIRKTRTDMPSPQQQHEALKRFMAAVDAREGEPLTDEDFAALDNSCVSFKKDLDL